LSRTAYTRACLTQLPGRTHIVANTTVLGRSQRIEAHASAKQLAHSTLTDTAEALLACSTDGITGRHEWTAHAQLTNLCSAALHAARSAVDRVGRRVFATTGASQHVARTDAHAVGTRACTTIPAATSAIARIGATIDTGAPAQQLTRRGTGRNESSSTRAQRVAGGGSRSVRAASTRGKQAEQGDPEPRAKHSHRGTSNSLIWKRVRNLSDQLSVQRV
jgi:hypothetical protein